MDSKTEYYELLAKFLSNELTHGERERLQQWIAEDPLNEETMKVATRIWKLSNKKIQLEDSSTEEEWQRLKSSLNRIEKPTPHIKSFVHDVPLYWKIAASILIVAVVGFFILNWSSESSERKIAEEKSPQEIDTPEAGLRVYKTDDSVQLFYLPDGSKVMLNRYSTLTFSIPFNDREVTLDGAGFFDIEKDASHTFTIYTWDVITQVLGTSFNLRAYEKSDTIVLSLKTGQVKISEPAGKELFVVPGENVFYFKKKQLLTKSTDNLPSKPMPSAKNKGKDDDTKKEDSNKKDSNKNELTNPSYYLKTTFQSQKNRLNQTIIEGTITNTATTTSYTNIQLKITYEKKKGRKGEQKLMISDFYKLSPGESMPFRVPLMDVFTRERDIIVEVIDAKVIAK